MSSISMENQIFTPSHVANFILENAGNEKLEITPLKLHKLVYLVYGWVRAVLDKRLFDEPICAWKLGPVVPSLYHEFKRFGNLPITEKSICMEEDGELSTPSIPSDSRITKVMKIAWDVYKPFKASALVSKTHEPDSPWATHYMPDKSEPIPDEEIKEYFTKTIKEYINCVS